MLSNSSKVKILIIRFSAMGDIIYTSPIIRCLKLQIPNAEIHYFTKPNFKYLLENNPYVDYLHLLDKDLSSNIAELKKINFNYVIDLHNSLRSTIVKYKLGVKSSTYKKNRLKKWLAIHFKVNYVKPTHLVDRYFEAVSFLNVVNDGKPIDYFIPSNENNFDSLIAPELEKAYIAFIIGATHNTKRLPNYKVIEIVKNLRYPVVLLGGKDVALNGIEIAKACDNVYNYCGKVSLNQSVLIVKNAYKVIGFDTGLTHISEAFNKQLVSIWGSTIPELLGVQPYLVSNHLEVGVDLPCRPCSKFGLDKCPKRHFNCMHQIDIKKILNFIHE